MFCPGCAAENGDNSRFCRRCGIDISLVPQALSHALPDVSQREDGASQYAVKIESSLKKSFIGLFFLLMFLSIAIGFGYVFYLPTALAPFFAVLFLLGLGGANFAMYTIWLPEQYTTDCRGSAFAFATSVGRFAGAGITFLVGAGVARYGTIGTPVAFTSIAFVAGMLLLPFGEETRGRALPA